MGSETSFSEKLRVVIVNGRPGSGKTLFENMCKNYMGEKCGIFSTIDGIKELARMGGWDGKKELRDRKFLSDLKDLFTAYNNFPFNDVIEKVTRFENGLRIFDIIDFPHVVFIDCREPEEIEKLKNYFGKKATTLILWRPDTDFNKTSNHADEKVWQYNYDCIIENGGTLAELNEKAKGFLDLIFS